MNKQSRRITWIISVVIVAALVFFSMQSTSGYLPAWFATLALSILLLYVLSIPRFIKVNDDSLEIHCLVELTRIAVEDVKSIRKIERKSMRHCIPLLGSYGFFGFFGYYYNFAEMSVFKIYASKWGNFVRIEDIYEDIYIVNCRQADELIYLVNKAKHSKLLGKGERSGNITET